MKRLILLTALFICFAALWAGDTEKDTKTIRAIMDHQVNEWNKGNVEGFMSGYWKSENMTFQSGNKRLNGYGALSAMYKKNYAGAKMGKLTFKDIVIKPLGKNIYIVLGRWNVKTEASEKEGLFTLIIRKIKNQWKIIHDHSS
jgi:ketosteroid isomerase-like protein